MHESSTTSTVAYGDVSSTAYWTNWSRSAYHPGMVAWLNIRMRTSDATDRGRFILANVEGHHVDIQNGYYFGDGSQNWNAYYESCICKYTVRPEKDVFLW